jgi:hypothetical protein
MGQLIRKRLATKKKEKKEIAGGYKHLRQSCCKNNYVF